MSSSAGIELTFVLPARDEESLVQRALASIQNQDCGPAVEAVVVENGSKDATAQRVREFADAHPGFELRLVRLPEPNRSLAKNAGAKAARGSILVFMDADSVASSGLAAAVMEAAARCPAGSIRIMADGGDLLDRFFFDLLEFGKGLFGIRAQMFYCRRDLFLALGGFRAELMLAEDLELIQRVQRQGHTVTHIADEHIASSVRRLHELPLRLSVASTLIRWGLAHAGLGRRWRY